MYAAVFIAELHYRDERYEAMAAQLRTIAMEQYGCIDVVSVSEGNREITISYWKDLQHMQKWKDAPEHRKAQQLGQSLWYASYKVQIVQILRA